MKNSSTLYSRLKPTFFIILITLFLSACSTADIGGTDTGSVTEDDDPNSNNLLEVSGKLEVIDTATGEVLNISNAFIAETHIGTYGTLEIDSNGNWYYQADNTQSVIQNLSDGETLEDIFVINGIEDSSHTITITIYGVDDEVADETTPIDSEVDDNTDDANNDPGNGTEPDPIIVNQPAVISGSDKGQVTEDLDNNNDGVISTSGKLSITDTDPGEAAFKSGKISGSHGAIDLSSNGNWTYVLNNQSSTVQNLNAGQSLKDNLTVSSVDDTKHTVAITILGADEPNSPAVISGSDKGQVTEDLDNNNDGVISISGQLSITDTDPGEAAFNAGKINGSHGTIDLTSNGNWTYVLNNQSSTVQNLNAGQSLKDNLTVSSIDGTKHTVAITILGADEPNSPAVISGSDKGQVTEDLDSDNDGVISISGQLSITDTDPGEAAFNTASINGNHGTIDLTSNGNWTYVLNNQSSAVQNLNAGQSLKDNLTVSSVDGTSHVIAITIIGADEEVESGPIVAMYSYNADLSGAQKLSSASLEQTTVYMFFTNVSKYDSMTFNCCKGKSGDATGEAFSAPVQDTSAPFVYSVDLSQYSTSGTRVLKAVASNADGDDDLFVNFSINITSTPTEPEPEPTPEPTPDPTPEPGASSDITFTWVAPSEREDNSSISLSEINGYTIHYGTTPGSYNNKINIDDGSAVSHTITNLSAGTYYFSITTRDTDGNHSAYSPEIVIKI